MASMHDITKNTDLSLDDLEGLTDVERETLINLINELQTDGSSDTLRSLWYEDYNEVPVDIDTFIDDPRYLGNALGNTLYPFWRDVLRELFRPGAKYFECIGGDTIIPLLDGSRDSMKVIYERFSKDDDLWCYSVDESSERVVPGHITNVLITGIKPVYEVTLDTGGVLYTTNDHKYLTRSGVDTKLEDIVINETSLLPFSVYYNRDNEVVRHPCNEFIREDTHRMVGRYLYGEYNEDYDIHHKDHNHKNNVPSNLELLNYKEHHRHHMNYYWDTMSDEEYNKVCQIRSDRLSEFMNTDEGKDLARHNLASFNSRTDEEAIAIRSENGLKGIHNKGLAIGKKCLELYGTITKEYYKKVKSEYFYRTHPTYEYMMEKYNNNLSKFIEDSDNYNHKVISVKYVGDQIVYDIEVEKWHNFAVATIGDDYSKQGGYAKCCNNGVFVHNCILSGAIGIGKSTIADVGIAYILYKLLCMKNPQSYYGLTKSSIMTINFFNVSMNLSYGVAYSKLQQMLLSSPWFLEHGTVVGLKNKSFVPDYGIQLVVGSSEEHALGQDVFCCDYDTLIVTSNGVHKIGDLEGRYVRVLQYDDKGGFRFSEPCLIRLTKYTDELIKITLEDGTELKFTPEHRLMLKDGTYKMVKDLTSSDELMDF